MVRRWGTALFACALSLAAAGCVEEKTVPRTQLMLVVDTNIADLEQVELSVDGDDREPQVASTPLRADGAPLTLAIVREQGPLGPVHVAAAGFRAGTKVVERRAIVAFVEGKTLVVPLHLVRTCETTTCTANDTCTEQGCRPVQLDVNTLMAWQGSAPKLGDVSDMDASTTPLDAMLPDAELDSGVRDAASDGAIDAALGDAMAREASVQTCDASSVDTNTDKNNCGMCGRVCTTSAANTVAGCFNGACQVSCAPYFGDCNMDMANGCEMQLNYNVSNCGTCGKMCKPAESCTATGVCMK